MGLSRAYIMVMNRRRFIQSLAAMFTLPATPALSLPAAGAAAPTIAAVPANARFWAVYISALHGECTPRALQNMLKIPASDAQNYLAQLVADGVIKPNPLLRHAASELIKPKEDSLWNKLKERMDMKAQAESEPVAETEMPETFEAHGEAPEDAALVAMAVDEGEDGGICTSSYFL